MKRALKYEINQDEMFLRTIEKKLLINVEQFLYILSHFWIFCIENFDKNESDFAIFKIERNYLNKIKDSMENSLQTESNLDKNIITLFMNSFSFHSERLIIPKNLFEELGKFLFNLRILFQQINKIGGYN